MKMSEIFTRQEIYDFNMTWVEISDKLFINDKTVGTIEKRSIEKMRQEFRKRNIKYEDLV